MTRPADVSAAPIRVLIADDQALLRGSLRVLVDAEPGLVATSEAANGAEAVRGARQDLPDVVLMDVRMPGLDGIEATRQICGSPDTANVKVLILTMFDLDEYVYAALRAGAAWIPAQGHAARRTDRGDTGRRRRMMPCWHRP